MKRSALLFLCVAAAITIQAQAPQPPVTDAGRDWASPLGDPGSTRFSTLTQINDTNVQNLKRAWSFKAPGGRFAYPPMVVDSIIYFSDPTGVFAVDGVAGTLKWRYPPVAAGADPAEGAGTSVRGPVYWAGTATTGPRIYSQVIGGLAAIDARTGALVTTFGDNGVVPEVRFNSPPSIFRNLIITRGPAEGPKGNTIRAYDVVTGALKWTFYLKAQVGDPNRNSWQDGSADSAATPGLWGAFSIDEERGLLFVPTDKPEGPRINDYYGGGAPGDNLYANSLLAIDAATGKLKWHQQLVHHDIWDYDLGAAPVLFEVRRNGQVIPAVAQSTKMSLLFTFHRETGEPIFGMEERPVPQSTVPGEKTSPTQPFPLKPEPLARITASREELASLGKISPEHQKYCEGLWEQYKFTSVGIYQPWKTDENSLILPGAQGGSNWMGMTYNRSLGLLIGNVMEAGQLGRVQPGGGGGGGGRGAGGGRRGGAAPPAAGATPPTPPTPAAPAAPPAATAAPAAGAAPPSYSKTPGPFNRYWNTENMWSCSPTPWGSLVAVNANTGDIVWRVPLGEFEELTKKGIAPTGTPSSGGAITTAGNLVFIGATIDGFFRAFDARNGKELWRDKLPAPNQGMPATYLGRDGKQYVVISAAGGGFFRTPAGDEFIAYTVR
jgi:glucose dehydrogenase